jgi:hypothetical protein
MMSRLLTPRAGVSGYGDASTIRALRCLVFVAFA